MKIAFAAVNSPSLPDQLFLRHVAETSETLLEAGHEVFVYEIQGADAAHWDLPAEVVKSTVVAPDELLISSYHHSLHAFSDQLAKSMLGEMGEHSFDVIELPLWGGIGFSLIRSKRLLNSCVGCKLVVNAIHALDASGWDCGDPFSQMVQVEMERYCVRYADALCSPFEPVGSWMKLKCGRSDVLYYDSNSIIEGLKELEHAGDSVKACFDAMLSDYQPKDSPVPAIEVYKRDGKKRYQRTFKGAKVAVVIPFLGNECFDSRVASLPSNSEVELQIIAICDEQNEPLVSEFESLELPGLIKLTSRGQQFLLSTILEVCEDGYLVFEKAGVEYSEDYLLQATIVLERNSDISAVGTYARNSQLKYPFGNISGVMAIRNTCSVWGTVFRINKLEQLLGQFPSLCWTGDDWGLQLALVEKYQSIDILPNTGLTYEIERESYEAAFNPTRVVEKLKTYPRSWSSFAGDLVPLLIGSPDWLSSIWSQDEGCPGFELPIADLPSSVPAVKLDVDTEAEEEGSVTSVASDPHFVDDSIIEGSLEDETDSDSEEPSVFAPDLDDAQTDVDVEVSPLNDLTSEIDLDEQQSEIAVDPEEETVEPIMDLSSELSVDESVSDSNEGADLLNGGISFKDDEELELAADLGENSDEQNEAERSEEASENFVDLDLDEEAEISDEVLDAWSSSDTDELEGEPDAELEVGQFDSIYLPSEEASKDENEDDWTEFPENSGITKLGEESEETTLGSVAEIEEESQPLKLKKEDESENIESQHTEAEEAVKPGEVEEAEEEDNPMDHFQIFWSDGIEAFNQTNSTLESYLAHETHGLEIRIDSDTQVKKIRLDPSDRKGRLYLRRIEIWNSKTHMPVFVSSEENAFDNIEPYGDYEVEGIEHDSLILNSIGNDPQIFLEIEESECQSIMISVEYSFHRPE